MAYNPFANATLLKQSVPVIDRAEIEIKNTIMNGVLWGVSQASLYKKINKIINKCIDNLPADFPDANKTRQELASSAVVWYQGFQRSIMLLSLFLIDETREIPHYSVLKPLTPAEINKMPTDIKVSYVSKLKSQIVKLTNLPIKDYKQESSLSIWARSEIDIRANEHKKKINELVAEGKTIRRLSSHADCSERCEKWQGKLVDLVKPPINSKLETGDLIQGEPVYSLEAITSIRDKYGYRNNIITGFNCRHRLVEVDSKQLDYAPGVIKRERAINAKMRALENATKKPLKEYQALRSVKLKGKDINELNGDYVRKKWQDYLLARSRAVDFAKKHDLPVYDWRMEVPSELWR